MRLGWAIQSSWTNGVRWNGNMGDEELQALAIQVRRMVFYIL
jgi:hypothetical protein